jgi:hypothetical protein
VKEMPWKITHFDSRCPASKPYAVVKKDTGELVACHDSKGSAQSQLSALYANEPKMKE